tara:strand:- start:183 stop:338 length:156 start_codon:yes stop_codon:yes gene_type:complete
MFQDRQINIERLHSITSGIETIRQFDGEDVVFVRNSTGVFIHGNSAEDACS